MNNVSLTGTLATEVEVKETTGLAGQSVASFILMVPRNEYEGDFFRVKAWNSEAIKAAQMRKGDLIAVEGSLRQDVYEKDGEERKAVSVVARRLESLR